MHPVTHVQVQREIEIHSQLIHPNIVNFYGAFEDDSHYYIVEEYADGVRAK